MIVTLRCIRTGLAYALKLSDCMELRYSHLLAHNTYMRSRNSLASVFALERLDRHPHPFVGSQLAFLKPIATAHTHTHPEVITIGHHLPIPTSPVRRCASTGRLINVHSELFNKLIPILPVKIA